MGDVGRISLQIPLHFIQLVLAGVLDLSRLVL